MISSEDESHLRNQFRFLEKVLTEANKNLNKHPWIALFMFHSFYSHKSDYPNNVHKNVDVNCYLIFITINFITINLNYSF